MGELIYLDEITYYEKQVDLAAMKLKLARLKEEEAIEKENVRRPEIGNADGSKTYVDRESVLRNEIKRLEQELDKAIILKGHNVEDAVDLGDIVTIDMQYALEDAEEFTFMLIGGDTNTDGDINKVTMNSPLGLAVYKGKIGDKISYIVENNTTWVTIKDIEKQYNKGISR